MYSAEELLNEIRVLKEIKEHYECMIAELKEKIHDLENPLCDCMRDPEDERSYYGKIEEENIRLRKIIKLLSENL